MLTSIGRLKITGNRLVVFVDLMSRVDLWCTHKGKTIRFADRAEARAFAEKKGYDDGLHFKVARGYGLKRRVDALMG